MISELICHWAVMTKLCEESAVMTQIATSNNGLTFLLPRKVRMCQEVPPFKKTDSYFKLGPHYMI